MAMAQCKYRTELENKCCKEQALSKSTKGYCIFHEELKNKGIDKCMKQFYEKISQA